MVKTHSRFPWPQWPVWWHSFSLGRLSGCNVPLTKHMIVDKIPGILSNYLFHYHVSQVTCNSFCYSSLPPPLFSQRSLHLVLLLMLRSLNDWTVLKNNNKKQISDLFTLLFYSISREIWLLVNCLPKQFSICEERLGDWQVQYVTSALYQFKCTSAEGLLLFVLVKACCNSADKQQY